MRIFLNFVLRSIADDKQRLPTPLNCHKGLMAWYYIFENREKALTMILRSISVRAFTNIVIASILSIMTSHAQVTRPSPLNDSDSNLRNIIAGLQKQIADLKAENELLKNQLTNS